MFSVIADTNIYISALNFGGPSHRFLNLAEAGGVFRLAVSDAILIEMTEVLRSVKFAWPEEEIRRARQQISWFTELVTSEEELAVIIVDPPDNRILECVMAASPTRS